MSVCCSSYQPYALLLNFAPCSLQSVQHMQPPRIKWVHPGTPLTATVLCSCALGCSRPISNTLVCTMSGFQPSHSRSASRQVV